MKYFLPALALAAGLLFTTTSSDAKVEYTKKEKKSCTTCHPSASSKELTEAGKYYKEKKTLEGYVKK
jgi:hypothetical protein